MREFSARISADADQDSLWIAEEKAIDVQMVDAHVEYRHSVVLTDEALPVGPSMHRNLGDDRIAEVAPVEECLQRPHRLVVPHVLVDGEEDARFVTEADDLRRVGQIRRQRFLGKDAPDVTGVLHCLPDDA